MPHHVFLSYSRKDSDMMARVRDDLRAAELDVWTDENLIPGTESWRKAIEQAIEETDCLVVILSPDAKKSEWVERELAYANTQHKRIFPILVRGNEFDTIPIELSTTQYVDVRSNYTVGIQRLIKAIRTHINIKGSRDSVANSVSDSHNFIPWNPRDWFRLLWWLCVKPQKLSIYAGEESVRITGAWLFSTLIWMPLVIPILGIKLNLVDARYGASINISFEIWGGLILAWLLTRFC